MKKSMTLLATVAIALLSTSAWAADFDAKLKRFIQVDKGRYTPELTCEEAVKLGFSVNDYNQYVTYVGQLNQAVPPALTQPENLFLASYLEVQDNQLVLTIPLEKALRAGATVEGYNQTLEFARAASLEKDTKWAEMQQYLTRKQQELQQYARQHPDSSAVMSVYVAPKR